MSSIPAGGIPTAKSMRGPQGVWIQNGKLFVADTQNHRVLIFNSIPTANGAAADLVLGQKSLTSFVEPDLRAPPQFGKLVHIKQFLRCAIRFRRVELDATVKPDNTRRRPRNVSIALNGKLSSTFAAMAHDPSIGRAEALRRAMIDIIDNGEAHETHPRYWAPFFVVGEGAAF